MLDIGWSELLLIGVVALIVIGPERLPKVARTIGHLVGRAQRYVSDVKTDIQREMDLGDLNDLTLCGTLSGIEMALEVAKVPYRKGGVQAALAYLAESSVALEPAARCKASR